MDRKRDNKENIRLKIFEPLLALCFLVLAAAIPLNAFAADLEDGDVQFWNIARADKKISSDWKVSVSEETRYGNGCSWIYYEYSDAGLIYSGLAKWLELSFYFRHGYFRNTGDKWYQEERPMINITPKMELFGFQIADRNRFEYRMINNLEDYVEYRNKITVFAPLKLTALEIQPFFENEPFYSFLKEQWVSNELTAGFVFKLIKELSVEIFYRSKSSRVKGDKWKDYNVIGTGLKCAF